MNIPRPFIKYVVILLVAGTCAAGLYFFRFSPEARAGRSLKRARMYFDAGQYARAKIEYINVLRQDMGSAEAMKRLGLIWLEQGAPLTALPFLLEGRKLNPGDRELRLELAKTVLGLGDPPGARALVNELLNEDPGDVEALRILAESARSPEEAQAVRERMEAFPDKNAEAYHLANALLLVKEGQGTDALKEAEKAIQANLSSPLGWQIVASIHHMEKDLAKAEEAFRKCSELASPRSLQRLKLAEFKLQIGDRDGARQLATAAVEQAPDYFPARILLAQIDFLGQKREEAMKALGEVLREDPKNYVAALTLAKMLQQTGQAAKAVETLEAMDRFYPNNPNLRMELAKAHALNGSVSRAVDLLGKLGEVAPDFVEPALLRAELNIRAGRARDAVTELSDLLAKHPSARAAELLCSAYQALDQAENAVEVARKLVAAEPDNSRFHLLLGQTLLNARMFEEARAALEKARALSPESVALVSLLVDLDRVERRFDQALERVEAFLKEKPDSAEAYFVKSGVLQDQGETAAAEESLAKAVELDANFSPAYERLIRLYVDGGKIPEATERLEEVLVLQPANEQAMLLLALLRERQGDYEKALDSYEKVLNLRPDNLVALNNVAMLCAVRLNKLDRAYEVARKARILRPAVGAEATPGERAIAAFVADTLGWVLYLRGEYAEALTLLREAAGPLAAHPEVRYHQGMASYMMGRKEEAREALRFAVSSPGDFPGKEEAKSRLALLENLEGEPGREETPQTAGELEKLAQASPSDTLLLNRLGEAYEQEENWTKAAEAYERALRLNPALAEVAGKLAVLYAGPLEDRAMARELARKARELDPNGPVVAGLVGLAALRAEDYPRAYSLLGESARRAGAVADARTLHGLGWAAYSQGKVSEAREAMRKALETAPGFAEAEDARTFLALTDDGAEAETEVSPEAVLQKEPGHVPALMARAKEREASGETAGAVADYQAALARYPDFGPAQKRLAALYADDPAKRSQAYELAQKARRALPNDPELARILGELSCHRKDFTYAETLLLESHRAKPLDARGLYFLGLARFGKGAKEAAAESLSQAVEAGLAEPFLADARRMLEELGKGSGDSGS